MSNDTMSAEEIVRGRIDDIKARCDAATPGTWKCWHKDMDFGGSVKFTIGDAAVVQEENQRNIGPIFVKEDADFIAAAREDIPYLLVRVAELEGQLDEKAEEAEMYKILRADADRIREGMMQNEMRLISDKMRMESQLTASEQRERAARNELCLKCGRYHEAHKGACDGCRWREQK